MLILHDQLRLYDGRWVSVLHSIDRKTYFQKKLNLFPAAVPLELVAMKIPGPLTKFKSGN